MSPIARLRGTLEEHGPGWAVVEIGGIGFQVFLPTGAVDGLAPGAQVDLFTHLYVREDQLTLYGFTSRPARELFLMLIGVSGIGPKGALAVLSAIPPDELAGAIATGDVDRLRRVPGIGAKTAGRLVLEMQERLKGMGIVGDGGASGQNDVVAALVALGYTGAEASAAAKAAAEPGLSLEEQITLALKRLATL